MTIKKPILSKLKLRIQGLPIIAFSKMIRHTMNVALIYRGKASSPSQYLSFFSDHMKNFITKTTIIPVIKN